MSEPVYSDYLTMFDFAIRRSLQPAVEAPLIQINNDGQFVPPPDRPTISANMTEDQARSPSIDTDTATLARIASAGGLE